MTDRRPHPLHQGERIVQRRMNTPNDLVEYLPSYIDPTMSQQHSDFYSGLLYLSVSTVDKDGRPWATLLVTKSHENPLVGITMAAPQELEVLSLNSAFDPVVRALQERQHSSTTDGALFAGVGVDFSNRRRNKLAGSISSFAMRSQDQLALTLLSNQHLGNCPKYITVRSLEPFARESVVTLDQFDSFAGSLPEQCKALIARATTVYLATRHLPDSAAAPAEERDMGLNHRGGEPGFVRLYEDATDAADTGDQLPQDSLTTYLVLPDHSGNRFYQSLGNVQSDRLVGLTFPDFTNGDMLYLTGIAENLFDEEAEALMPRVRLLTRVQITGAVYVTGAMQLRLISNEEYSPYNPPVRYLRSELENQNPEQESCASTTQQIRANLISIRRLSGSVSTFTFELSTPVAATLPGGFGIFDFSAYFDSAYRHMDEANPQAVNDDYVRTWTISSAADFSAKDNRLDQVERLDITVKHKSGGAVSSFLHDDNLRLPLSVGFVGNGGGFSCFSRETPNTLPTVPPSMLWVAGGVGITPFMSMWDGILNLNKALEDIGEQLVANIVLVFASRDDDVELLRHFLARNGLNRVRLTILALQSLSEDTEPGCAAKDALIRAYPDAAMTIVQQRIDSSSLAQIDNLAEREIFLCGPDGFMRHTQQLLQSIVGADLKLRTESYAF